MAIGVSDRQLNDIIGQAKQQLAIDPDCGTAWQSLGLAYRQQQDFPAAQAALEQATLLSPLTPLARLALADCYLSAGRSQLSQELYRLVAQDEPQPSPCIVLAAARGLGMTGDFHHAAQACRELLLLHPDHAQAYFDLGHYLSCQGAPLAVVEGLAREAIARAPEVTAYRTALAGLLWSRERLVEALAIVRPLTCRQLLSLSCRGCLSRLRDMFLEAGDDDRAGVCHERLAQLDSDAIADRC